MVGRRRTPPAPSNGGCERWQMLLLTSRPVPDTGEMDVNDVPPRASGRNVKRITNDVLWSLACTKDASLNLTAEQ